MIYLFEHVPAIVGIRKKKEEKLLQFGTSRLFPN